MLIDMTILMLFNKIFALRIVEQLVMSSRPETPCLPLTHKEASKYLSRWPY